MLFSIIKYEFYVSKNSVNIIFLQSSWVLFGVITVQKVMQTVPNGSVFVSVIVNQDTL